MLVQGSAVHNSAFYLGKKHLAPNEPAMHFGATMTTFGIAVGSTKVPKVMEPPTYFH
jgi:hypothetical protein